MTVRPALPRTGGEVERAYATTDPMEYFAEASEAYRRPSLLETIGGRIARAVPALGEMVIGKLDGYLLVAILWRATQGVAGASSTTAATPTAMPSDCAVRPSRLPVALMLLAIWYSYNARRDA